MSNILKGREIFAVGKWNGMRFTTEDLDDIVANFDRLKEIHKVPLKFGHNDDQPVTDGQPAIGWVDRVYREGKKLYADFTDVPNTVFNAMKKKLYRTVSIELLFGVSRDDGQHFDNVLDAVALLGCDHPAVNNLNDLDALLAMRASFSGGHRVAFETVAGKNLVKLDKFEGIEMDKNEIQGLIDAAIAPLKEANVQLSADLKAEKDKTANFERDRRLNETRRKEEAIRFARKSVMGALDTAVQRGAITPAARELYERQIGVNDDDRVLALNVGEIRQMFDVKSAQPQNSAFSRGGNEQAQSEDAETALIGLVQKNMEQTGESDFAASFSRVAAANPKLHREYLDSNGVK